MYTEARMSTESHYHSKKDRIFVRAIQGQYSLKEELARLRAMPRVRKGKELKFVDGPQTYSRHYVEPKDGITQMFHLHLEEYAPGESRRSTGTSTRRRSISSTARATRSTTACATTGRRATSRSCTTTACTSTSTRAPTSRRALVIKTKPMFMFMNMLFQQLVEPRPTTPAPGAENFKVRESEE